MAVANILCQTKRWFAFSLILLLFSEFGSKWFTAICVWQINATRSTGIWMSGLWSRCYLCNVCWMFQCFWAQKSQLSDFYNRRYGSQHMIIFKVPKWQLSPFNGFGILLYLKGRCFLSRNFVPWVAIRYVIKVIANAQRRRIGTSGPKAKKELCNVFKIILGNMYLANFTSNRKIGFKPNMY